MKATTNLSGIDDRKTAEGIERANYSRIVFSKAVRDGIDLAIMCVKHFNPVPTLLLWLLDCGLIYGLLMVIRSMNIVSIGFMDSWEGITMVSFALALVISIYHYLIIYLNQHMFRNLP